MADRKFEYGDRVRHSRRPEWGIGSIVKAEDMSVNGTPSQRVSVRFPNAGLKNISTAHAELELITEIEEGAVGGDDDHPVAAWHRMTDSDWLGEVAQRKVEEAMVALAPAATDPFNPVGKRISACFDLYRFERTGLSLIDWAVAQSGLDDPLSRFTRHELEVLFDQWAAQRDDHLFRLLREFEGSNDIEARLASAPAGAREAVRRFTAER